MPSDKKRVQVLYRPSVLEELERLAAEEQVSLSRITTMLVDEALAYRKNAVATSSPKPSPAPSDLSTDDIEIDPDDMKLLKKIRVLKEMGLF